MMGFGLKGFEPLLRGADLDGAVILCESAESAEKNALCWQFIREGLSSGEKALIILAHVHVEDMKRGLANLGVSFDDEVAKGRIAFLNWSEIARPDKASATLRIPSLIATKFAALGAGSRKRVLLIGLHHLLVSIPPDQLPKFITDLVGQIRAEVSLGCAVIDPASVPVKAIPDIREPFDGVLRITRDNIGQGLMIGVEAFDGVERTGVFLPLGKIGEEYVAGLAALKGSAAEACPSCGFQVLPGFDVCPRCKADLKGLDAAPPAGAPSVFDYLEKLRVQTGVSVPVDKAGKAADERKRQLEEFLHSVGVTGEQQKEQAKEKLRALARSRAVPRRPARAPGRTNGLTNGLTKVAGLVNGLARGSGLVNGLSRTTGKVNGTGKTNGLVNGLRKARRGMTNGLTNGNGFTNGLGSKRFQKQTRHARWKILIPPAVAAALFLAPMLVPSALFKPIFVLKSDGSFDEWSGAPPLDRNQSLGSSIDIITGDVKSNEGRLGIYIGVAGNMLAGEASGRSSDIVEAFFDADHDAGTGYAIKGLGADYLLQAIGQGHGVLRSGFFTWTQRSSLGNMDWSNWRLDLPVVVSLGNGPDFGKMEATVDITGPPTKNAALIAAGSVLLHTQSWDNQEDYSEFTLSEGRPSLEVVQTSVAPLTAAPGIIPLLKISFRSLHGPLSVAGVDLKVLGTAGAGNVTAFTARDEAGNAIGTRVYAGGLVSINFNSPLSIGSAWKSVTFEASVTASNGATLGLSLSDSSPVRAIDTAISIFSGPSARQRTYLGTIPTGVVIDGGFADWTGANSDSKGDSSVKGNKAIDITGFDAHRDSSRVSFYARVDGAIMSGTATPVVLPSRQQVQPVPDTDFDTVPDTFEEMYNNILALDFNNDNVSDASANHDVDGDGVLDWPSGPDQWLNTTIPSWYGSSYAGRVVSVYIGEEYIPPRNLGEDRLRIFLDTDEVAGSGYRVKNIYADYMVEVSGKNGEVLSGKYSSFAGPTPFTWAWTERGAISYEAGQSELEGEITIPGLPPTVNVTAVLDMRDWRGDWDDTVPARTRSMTRSADGGMSIQRDSYEVRFPGSVSADDVSFRDDQGYGLSWRLSGMSVFKDGSKVESFPFAASSLLELSGLDASYAIADSGMSVAYAAESGRLKEELILAEPPQFISGDSDEFAVEFDVTYIDGVEPDLDGSAVTRTDGAGVESYSFTTSEGLQFRVGQIPAFSLAPAFAIDAHGQTVSCSYTTTYGASPADIRIGCPAGWLRSASYPVTIDPTILMNGYRGENFGFALATGDVNGDGKSDLLVGAPYNNIGGSGIGRAYLYLGGATMNNVVDLEIAGPSAGSHFGWSATVGDLNNDGYADMIIGAPDYNSGDGKVAVYMGSATPNAAPDHYLVSRQTGEKFGYSLAIGNFNGDSYKDVIVGAPLNDSGNTDSGSAYIYFGASSFDAEVDRIFHGPNQGEQFGYAVGSGNFNGDSYEDAAIGAPNYVFTPALADGRVGIFFGGANMDTTQDVNCVNGNNNEELGTSIAAADYNADGYQDLYAGGPKYGASNNGRVEIFYGGSSMDGTVDASFPSPAANAYFGMSLTSGKIGSDTVLELAIGSPKYILGGAPNERGRFDLYWNATSGSFATRNGDNDLDHFAYALAIGDLNSTTTYGELAVGAIDYDVVDSTNSGKVYIFNGANPAGFDTTPDLQIVSKDPGSRSGEMLGYSVATGDFNNDGKQDVISGAPYNANLGSDTGAAFIYFGKPFLDGYYGPDMMLPGQYAGERFGWNVSTGDFNGDGYDDALVGAPYNDEGGTDIGRAYVFYGGASMNNVVDVDIAGQSSGEMFGWDVAGGNVNGDLNAGKPLDDMVIGAPQNGSGKGKVYIYFGSTSLSNPLSTPSAKLYRGDAEAFGTSLTVGNFNQDSYEDILVGAPLNDTSSTDIGAAYVYYGCSSIGSVTCFRNPDTNWLYTAYVASVGGGDTTGDLLGDAQTDNANDASPPNVVTQGDGFYTVVKNARMQFDSTYVAGLTYGNVVGAWLRTQESSVSGYSGNSSLMWKYSGSGWANTNITPSGNDNGVLGWYNVFAQGVNSKAKIGSVRMDFYSFDGGGSQAVDWDYIWVVAVMRGQQPANITLAGQINQEHFGQSVETGDFDGDSSYLDDAVIGAPFYSAANDTGAAYIISGSTIRATSNGGTISTPTKILYGPGTTTAKFGWSLASGNINGDSYDDLIVGAPFNNSNMGVVYFYYGPASSMTLSFTSNGEVNEKRGWAVAAADLVTGYNAEAAMGGPAWDGSSNDGRVVILTPVPEFGDALLPVVVILLVGLAVSRKRPKRRR